MRKPYDLQALMHEMQQSARQGLVSIEDMRRMTDLVLDRLGCTTGAEAFDRLYGDWRQLPRGTVMSGLRAGQILGMLPMLRFDEVVGDRQREDELRDEARRYGPEGGKWQSAVISMGASAGAQRMADPGEMEAAIGRMEEALALVEPGSREADALGVQHAVLRLHLAQLTGGEDDFDSAVDDLARLIGSPIWDDGQRTGMTAQLAVFRSHQAIRHQDEAALAEQIRVLESVLPTLPPDHMDRVGLQSQLEASRSHLAILRARRTGEWPSEDAAVSFTADAVRREIAGLPREARIDRLVETGIILGGRAQMAKDHAGLVEAQGLLREALDHLQPDDERWTRAAFTLGLSHMIQAVLSLAPRRDRTPHLDQGISWLRHARRLVRGPEHPLWGNMSMGLADAHRVRGDVVHAVDPQAKRRHHAEARRLGLESLTASVWAVLLQTGTAHAAQTARYASERAFQVARWCLDDGAPADAVRALDSGRGLTLHAATVATTVPDMLDALGRSDLADEWRRAGPAAVPEQGPGTAPNAPVTGPGSRLRRRVLQALAASPLRRRLLNTPTPEEIGAALRTLGATALVYLVPADDEERSMKDQVFFGLRALPGMAVLVRADGSVRTLELPDLSVSAPELAEYRALGTPGRDAGGPPTEAAAAPVPPRRTGESRAALDRLCDWAGTVAMRPLLRELARDGGPAPRLVLVPMAELGLVPWHAARLRRRGTTGVYACQQADISYLPSARLLCEVAARPAAGIRQPLVVGNPTRDLHHAGEEAEAIHRAFHPGGDLLGPGTATPAAVTDWLRGQRGGLLHLACHGVVRRGERRSSSLVLAGGDLAAEELTEGGARCERLDLVVLAACRTSVSGHGYDEAYSLSTAFLVAGARSVIGSLWPVPDEATSLLMYMTHHYLSRERLTRGRRCAGPSSGCSTTGARRRPGCRTGFRSGYGGSRATT
ncbi:CHAT domain-containing protein [Streptomyces clavuligerus]|uniref:CHAT domain-containing protein n=1 Tax=Streptomyces clavuligerus TaxID=1901 RepID=UPI001E5A80B3|nr:CHAT domain-containing protein [Streptomyces clavuligerus]